MTTPMEDLNKSLAKLGPKGGRELVKVTNEDQDESWWAEKVDDSTYRSLNNSFSVATLAFPPEFDATAMQAAFPGYPGQENNGRRYRILWGHLIKCDRLGGRLVVRFIVGWDGTEREDP